ncbi:hypothetical protein TRFO_30962 [Tritrichomonas foetus]|uniref:CCZ1/INTU/HSP4 first Longin domain-containing protein n=1 Tax=Tritrichomonas foetus TaxID=1144522 RepID=A0A1J4JXN6_9EUKA|nr:hypothetical protein TRFO_30962 [Tritrichomonas foetus]|eukprot:OHT02045.1 hypothetical protein TRFO_30962 [Tritrichomonas foetus]
MNSLFNFIVFDSIVEEKEGAVNDVFYSFSTNNEFNNDENRKMIEVGILTTFIFFCNNFKPNNNCDYIFTGKREICLIHIGESVFISASLISTVATHRLVLQSVLNSIKNILFLNILPPKRNGNGKITNEFQTGINKFLPQIISLIRWNDLIFTELWDASLPLVGLSQQSRNLFEYDLREVQNDNDFIFGLILTVRDKLIAHTTDPELSRLLITLIFSKFSFFFPRKLKKKENVLRWIIGYNKEQNGSINVFTPPIIWNGKKYAIAALQYNKVRLIMILDPNKTDLYSQLNTITKKLSLIMFRCDSLDDPTMKIKNIFGKQIGAKLIHMPASKELKLLTNKLQQYDYKTIENGMLIAYKTSLNLKGNISSGVFPVSDGFMVFFERNIHKKPYYDKIIVTKFKPFDLSQVIQFLRNITDDNEVSSSNSIKSMNSSDI